MMWTRRKSLHALAASVASLFVGKRLLAETPAPLGSVTPVGTVAPEGATLPHPCGCDSATYCCFAAQPGEPMHSTIIEYPKKYGQIWVFYVLTDPEVSYEAKLAHAQGIRNLIKTMPGFRDHAVLPSDVPRMTWKSTGVKASHA